MASSFATAFGYAVSYKYANENMANLIKSVAEKIGRGVQTSNGFVYSAFRTACNVGRQWTKQIDKNYAHDNALVFICDKDGYYDRQYFGICTHNVTEYNLAHNSGLATTNIPATIYLHH